MQKPLVHISLADGSSHQGALSSPAELPVCGELVFTTGMTGYAEALTDPSYRGQLLLFTYPLIGNYGVGELSALESMAIQPSAILVSELSSVWSHHTALQGLSSWASSQGVPLVSGVDTRHLTRRLRSQGTMLAAISNDPTFPTPSKEARKAPLVAEVTPSECFEVRQSTQRIVVVDCGMKESLWRQLLASGYSLLRVPYNYDYSKELFDGLFLSNGPGDPTECIETIAILQRALLQRKPLFGVCLGAQLLALAAGGTTYKLPYGHRSHNQPCRHVASGRCFITSQNHGYAVAADSLPTAWQVTFTNLHDNSVEGIASRENPFFAVQFHPEASPGPTDTTWLFNDFFEEVGRAAQSRR